MIIRHVDKNYVIKTFDVLRIDLTEVFMASIGEPSTAKETIRWFYGGKKGWRHPDDAPENFVVDSEW